MSFVENCKSPEMTRGFAISFAQENRNKRNLAMNVPESKDVFDKLLQWADVWIESSKPACMTSGATPTNMCSS